MTCFFLTVPELHQPADGEERENKAAEAIRAIVQAFFIRLFGRDAHHHGGGRAQENGRRGVHRGDGPREREAVRGEVVAECHVVSQADRIREVRVSAEGVERRPVIQRQEAGARRRTRARVQRPGREQLHVLDLGG